MLMQVPRLVVTSGLHMLIPWCLIPVTPKSGALVQWYVIYSVADITHDVEARQHWDKHFPVVEVLETHKHYRVVYWYGCSLAVHAYC